MKEVSIKPSQINVAKKVASGVGFYAV